MGKKLRKELDKIEEAINKIGVLVFNESFWEEKDYSKFWELEEKSIDFRLRCLEDEIIDLKQKICNHDYQKKTCEICGKDLNK